MVSAAARKEGELLQSLLDNKAHGILGKDHGFPRSTQAVWELWGTVYVTRSSFHALWQEIQTNDNNTLSGSTFLWHFWSASSIFITIIKRVPWWELSHTVNWNDQGSNKRKEFLMSCNKFPIVLEHAFAFFFKHLFQILHESSMIWISKAGFALVHLRNLCHVMVGVGELDMRSWLCPRRFAYVLQG